MFSLVGVVTEFGTLEGIWSATGVKFIPVGALSLVGVSSEVGSLWGMLIGYSR